MTPVDPQQWTAIELERKGYAFNRTRQAFLSTELRVANTRLSRLRGLLGTREPEFPFGRGLLIVPCHGVHTVGMRFDIDVVYLSPEGEVLRLEVKVKPWRFTSISLDAIAVLELPAHTIVHTGTRTGDVIEIGLEAHRKGAA